MDNKFQPNLEIVRLYDEEAIPARVTKVGILPFIPDAQAEQWKVLLMCPQAKAKDLGKPLFQLAKGTRRTAVDGAWRDMREADLHHPDDALHEPLVETALREGGEETGLKPENIIRLFDMGGFTFTSASKGTERPLRMFAGHIRDARDFADFEPTTADARWMTLAECMPLARPDHVRILLAITERLKRYLAQDPHGQANSDLAAY